MHIVIDGRRDTRLLVTSRVSEQMAHRSANEHGRHIKRVRGHILENCILSGAAMTRVECR